MVGPLKLTVSLDCVCGGDLHSESESAESSTVGALKLLGSAQSAEGAL